MKTYYLFHPNEEQPRLKTEMTVKEATEANRKLRDKGEPQRWKDKKALPTIKRERELTHPDYAFRRLLLLPKVTNKK